MVNPPTPLKPGALGEAAAAMGAMVALRRSRARLVS
jgi:hypothetical protein